jgi:hypothetical protein
MHGRPTPARRALLAAIALLTLLLAACASSAGAPEAPSRAAPSASASPPANATAPLTPATSPTAAPPPSITLDAVGDISLARQVVDRMQANGAAYPLALVAPLLDGDINVANLEGPLTDRGEPWPKSYNFRTPPQFAQALPDGHVGVVSLANNHIMDYGPTGLLDTLPALDAAGVRHFGAGANALAAELPAIVEVKGLRVAFLGYVATPDEGSGFKITQWAAGGGAPGVSIGTRLAIAAGVAAARDIADFVIVVVHAGDEYRTQPNATERALADAALAAGADAYIGAHAHVPQPIERRGSQLVAYGLGNFVFDLDDVDLANIPQPRVAPILELTLTRGHGVTSYSVVAVTLDDSQDRPRPATPDETGALRSIVGAP